jgi:uncharacterized protein YyaL (SSP411 family)
MINILNEEKSLYLLQHKDNPVAWQPYSAKTLGLAKILNKPLFISIGYSSCHWCHVMAHESFEMPSTADILNKYFIPVKLDREEFPEVDKSYQFYLQATGKRGGWPLSIFALPDGRAFFGGTYFPPEARHSLPAFRDIVTQLGELYKNKPEEAEKYAENYDNFRDKFYASEHTVEDLSGISTSDVLDIFKRMFDMEHGGLGTDAKFPNYPVLSAMLDFYDNPDVAAFLRLTADKLCTSGIYDHINGGFYRYAVDRGWTVPHFEKMLYDNAQNSVFLLEMFARTDNVLYLKIAEKTLDFILSEFSTEFGMITAMDADSIRDDGKSIEGYYYLATEAMVKPFAEHVTLHEGVININEADHDNYLNLEKYFDSIREKNTREKPAKDGKVILSQNMMFVSALLKMFEMSGRDYYLEQSSALLGKLRHFLINGTDLYRINYTGDIFANVTLEDYVHTIKAYIDFFEVTKERPFLAEAAALTQKALEIFAKDGVLYLDTAKKVIDTFDDSTQNPASLLTLILSQYGGLMGIENNRRIQDYAADRFIKYAGGHPTLLSAFKEYQNDII